MLRRVALVSFCLAILFFSIPGFPQEFRATVAGHVLDTSGRAIANATVEVVNLANNESHVAKPMIRGATPSLCCSLAITG